MYTRLSREGSEALAILQGLSAEMQKKKAEQQQETLDDFRCEEMRMDALSSNQE